MEIKVAFCYFIYSGYMHRFRLGHSHIGFVPQPMSNIRKTLGEILPLVEDKKYGNKL